MIDGVHRRRGDDRAVEHERELVRGAPAAAPYRRVADLAERLRCPASSNSMLTAHWPVLAPVCVVTEPLRRVDDVPPLDLDRAEDVLDRAVWRRR